MRNTLKSLIFYKKKSVKDEFMNENLMAGKSDKK